MEATCHVGRSKEVYEWRNSIYKGVDNGKKQVVFLMLRVLWQFYRRNRKYD
jgi:hypothetical protein